MGGKHRFAPLLAQERRALLFGQIIVWVRLGIYKGRVIGDPLWLDDLVVDAFNPLFVAFGRSNAIKPDAARSKVYCAVGKCRARRCPPVFQVFWLREDSPHEFAWGREDAFYHKIPLPYVRFDVFYRAVFVHLL